MGDRPQDYTVDGILADGKVSLQGVNTGVDVLGDNWQKVQVNVGQEVHGWLNLDGKKGPYFKVAEERRNGSAPSGKDNEGQIIGWAHTLAAFELAHNLSHSDVVERANKILDLRKSSARAGSTPPAQSPPTADTGAASQGADTAAAHPAPVGEDIPF